MPRARTWWLSLFFSSMNWILSPGSSVSPKLGHLMVGPLNNACILWLLFDRRLPVGGSGFQTLKDLEQCGSHPCAWLQSCLMTPDQLRFFCPERFDSCCPCIFFTRYRNTYWSLRLLSFDFPNGWKRNSRIQDSKPSQTLLQSYNMTLVYPWLTMWYFLGTQKCPFISLVENLTPELINVVKGDSVPATRHKRTNKQAYKHREFSHKCSFYFQRVESLASDPSRHCDASGKVRPW